MGKISLALGVVALAVLACNSLSALMGASKTPQAPRAAEVTSEGTNPQAHCVQEGYPCTYADASPQVLERTLDLLDQASAVMESGGTIEQAAAFLQEQDDVVDEMHDRLALRFRIEGGPPMWLIDPAVMEASAAETAHQVGGLAAPVADDGGPVGDQKEGEEPQHKALILEPFLWDFKTNEGGAVTQALAKSRNYQCADCRDYIFTAADDIDVDGDGHVDDSPHGGVSLADFQDWDRFDIIHVSTHGAQLCTNELNFTPDSYSPPAPSDCYTAIFTGISMSEAAYKKAEGIPGFSTPGAIWARHPDKPECHSNSTSAGDFGTEGCAEAGRLWLGVTADFFLFGYPGGLDDKLIFLSACESMKGTDLATALAGDNTTVLGWTESVGADASLAVVESFYKHYIGDNLRPEPAYEETKDEVGSELLSHLKPKGGGSYTGAAPEIIRGGSPDPHGREVITIMHPIYRQELKEDGSMLIEGIPGDGQPDKMLFQAKLEGIDDSQKPSDFVVHLIIDDKQIQETYRPETQISDYAYETKMEEVPLGFDVTGREVVKIDAWVELPEGGVSRHVIERARLASCGWTGSMSGTRSGPLSGDLVLNLLDFNDVDPETWAQLGFPDGGPPIPNGPAVETVMLTGHPPYPALMVNELGSAMAIFSGANDAAIGAAAQSPLQFSVHNDMYFAGTANATLLDVLNQGKVTITADFVWNADSLCDLKLIAAAAANAPDGANSP